MSRDNNPDGVSKLRGQLPWLLAPCPLLPGPCPLPNITEAPSFKSLIDQLR